MSNIHILVQDVLRTQSRHSLPLRDYETNVSFIPVRRLFCHSARQENPDKREEKEGKSREVKHGPLISLFSLSACTLEY